jgi:hypothetical protein
MSRPLPILPPQFVKLAALYRSSTYEPERATARRKAEAILPPEAGGFERALRIQAYHDARERAGANNFMAGFDESIEIDQPGYMAEQAAKRAEKRRQQDVRRAELLAEFGSFDAVLKPSAQEKALLAAVKPWRVAQPGSRGRWTATLAGLDSYDHRKAPPDLVEAIRKALPWPRTYADAVAEVERWRQRDDDMQLAITADGGLSCGDYMLDRPAIWRMYMVKDFAEHGMELRTLPDIIARLRAYRFNEGGTDTDVEDAILRDLDALAAREAALSPLQMGFTSLEELVRQEGVALAAREGST